MRRGIHSYFLSQTIKQRFRLWIGTIIIALEFCIIVPFYFTEKHDRLNEAESQLKQIIALQSLYIERWSEEKLDTIKRFAKSDPAKLLQISELYKDIADYSRVHSEFDGIFFVDKEGYYRSEADSNAAIFVGDRSYFTEALQKKEHISDVLFSNLSGKQMITFSAPVLGDEGDFQGVVVGSVSLDMLDKLMEQLSFGKTGEVFVVDKTGKVITSSRSLSRPQADVMMTTKIIQRAYENIDSNDSYIGFHGDKVYGQYQWSTGENWIVVGEIAKKEIFQKLNRLIVTIIIISLIALLLSFIATVSITSRIERPIRYLLRGTKIIQSGNYDYQIDVDKIKLAPVELKQLCSTFNMMSSKLKTNIALLEHSALVDQLTQIHNRRFMMLEGSEQLQTCIVAGQPCSLMMLDIDHFKRINDTYGHLVGDRVLHHVAFLFKEEADLDTIVARYGGEEFIILALHKNAEETASLANKLRKRLMEEPYKDERVKVPLTVSIGVAEYSASPEYGTTVLEDMVSRADHALYRAKSGGRNRVELD
ncbi:diguanylate cyclase [Paenibacillus sp. SYP-B3998]|uniref:Diguanylate cyclase n=1 Tax=Paenibacillus sp. SYP-B3998 TaxID=2678564 RepID=A0A6G4A5X2_9BACL|nr:diguanylate cyclase [Paenibacillus sp. SYP-B3998]NEW09221.1 diguanylate cyclase [Paenibacillus sp. SYP-B3998]